MSGPSSPRSRVALLAALAAGLLLLLDVSLAATHRHADGDAHHACAVCVAGLVAGETPSPGPALGPPARRAHAVSHLVASVSTRLAGGPLRSRAPPA
jgi:hypothetical protein